MRIRILLCGFLTLNGFGQFLSERWNQAGDTYLVTVNAPAVRIEKVETGAAFSAQVIWQEVRPLGDGSHIGFPPTMTKVWRDSEGRSRSETARPGLFNADKIGRFILTEISDPVGRIVYILDDEHRIAYRFAAAVGPRQPAETPERTTSETPGSTVTEKLGSRNIEGVLAEGTRRTKTIPIGAIGNDRPLITTSEEWYSPELKREVLYTYSDPRAGERVRRTVKISREEPDPSVFQPPEGYAIADGAGTVRITLKRR
jgi:hypothetical protein